MRILVINPGSTSTKVAVYEDERPVLLRNIRHTADELQQYATSFDQLPLRQNKIVQTLEEGEIPFDFDAIVGRVNAQMLHDTRTAIRQHVCNLGCHIAAALASQIDHCEALIADPVIVDEMCAEARICGSPNMARNSVWHALNQRATARRHALAIGRRYEDLDLIVAHLGGGITIGVHHHGRTIDVNNGLDGEGPFSPERAGTLPSSDLIRICFSGEYTEEELLRFVGGKAGLMAWLGTSDTREILERIESGDEEAKLIMDAMIYHIAKGIAAQAAVLCGRYDAILITGGLAHAEYITSRLRERVSFIAPVHIYPGENEMEALAENALAVLRNQREVLEYR